MFQKNDSKNSSLKDEQTISVVAKRIKNGQREY